MSLTKEHVIWAFRLFLDRDQGGEGFITEKLESNTDTSAQTSECLRSKIKTYIET